MDFIPGHIYHVYNRGNEKQQIFFTDANYLYFLNKTRKYIAPHCDILAWCLMPNHFHFLIHANENSIVPKIEKPFPIFSLVDGFKNLLSSYSKAINVQQNRTGNLFQQKTKSKCVATAKGNYAATAFYYIHQNPLKAGIVDDLNGWEYSSYKDYAELRNGTLCNIDLAKALLEFDTYMFLHESKLALSQDSISKILV